MNWKSFGLIVVLALMTTGFGRPETTLRRAERGKETVPEINQTEGELPVELPIQELDGKDIPRSLRPIIEAENTNGLFADPREFDAKIELNPLGVYEPIRGKVFAVPYIPVPSDEFIEKLEGSNLSPELRRVLFFKHKGQDYVRYFLHPSRTEAYQELIDRHGIVRNEFFGFLGGSPRSIYVWDPQRPEVKPFQVKTSLHWLVNGDLKINNTNRIARSYLVNAFFDSIPAEKKREFNFELIPESLQLIPEDKWAGTMYREIPDEFLSPKSGKSYVPGFFLTGRAKGAAGDEKPLLLDLVRGRRDRVEAAVEVLRPLLRLSAYLMFEEGLKGELHEQNVYFELDKEGKPTGKLYVKDLDSFRVDMELRLRQGKSLEALKEVYKPFVYGKFAKAAGFGSSKVPFDQVAYSSFIRHTFGYSFCRVLRCSPEQEKKMFQLMDLAMAEEVSRITKIEISEGFIRKFSKSWLNEVAQKHKAKLRRDLGYETLGAELRDPEVQKVLRTEYLRLREKRRNSATIGNLDSDGAYFVLHGDIIEARFRYPPRGTDRTMGFTALETGDTPEFRRFMLNYERTLQKALRRQPLTCNRLF